MDDPSTSLRASCIFCKIVSKEVPAATVYEDEETFVFLDAKPVHPGHVLVVPRKHYRNVLDVPADIWSRMMETTRKMSRAVKEGVGADGINIIMNNEPAGHQLVFHAHIHVIPRFEGDGLESWHGRDYQTGEREDAFNKIKSALNS